MLWERSPVFSFLAASNKFFLLPIFGLVVSFVSIPTKRQIQFDEAIDETPVLKRGRWGDQKRRFLCRTLFITRGF